MKETPLLMRGPLVRATLEGRKTQTRRIVKPQPPVDVRSFYSSEKGWRWWTNNCRPFPGPSATAATNYLRCPYGGVGDRLWVVQEAPGVKGRSWQDRFWNRVFKTESCWEWMGHTNLKKQGQIRVGDKTRSVHRLSWEIHCGAIPEGLHVLHKCDVPWCVNPEHLYVGTNLQNIQDKVERSRCRKQCGSINGGSKLSDGQVKIIRAAYNSGEANQMVLSARFGVSQGQISKILSRKRWDSSVASGPAILGSRTLEITDVRVERLQDISAQDAIAEGIDCNKPSQPTAWSGDGGAHWQASAVAAYRTLWESINGPGSSYANPFVWVLTFQRVVRQEGRAA